MISTLIITGGSINKDFARNFINQKKFTNMIAVDGGLKVTDQLGLVPNMIVGDFDTIEPEILAKYKNQEHIEMRRFNPVKDFTDTESAIKAAIEIGSEEIFILGGTGSRLDHTLANIQLLQLPLEKRIPAYIINEQNKIMLIDEHTKELVFEQNEDSYPFLSLIPLTEVVEGITISGVKYPLENSTFYLNKMISLGVSNEITSKQAELSVKKGTLIVIRSCD